MDDLKRFLRDWLKKINEYNHDIADDKKIILDKRQFCEEDSGDYGLNDDFLDKCESATYCFIGDNPGENEKNQGEYFYYETNEKERDNRCAGSKIKKLVDTLVGKEVIYFNKCLIYTPRTKDLKRVDIEKTKGVVCEFIRWLSGINEDIIFVFFGVNEKFKSIYKELTQDVGRRSIITFHPCGSKYDKEDLSKKLLEREIVKVKFDDVSCFFGVKEDNDDDPPDDSNGLSPILMV